MARISKARIEELTETWGPDPLDDGEVILFQKQYSSGPMLYAYVALRANGKYFVTGQPVPMYWFELLDFAEEDNVLDLEIKMMVEAE